MNKKIVGLLIALVSIGGAVFISVYFSMQQESLPLPVLAIPAFGILLGVIIAATDLLRFCELEDECEDIKELVSDDIDDIKHFRLTRTWLYVAMTFILVGAEIWLLDHFHKYVAAWGALNVFILGLVIAIIALFISFRSEWFQYRYDRLEGWIYWAIVAGFILCTGLGVTLPNR